MNYFAGSCRSWLQWTSDGSEVIKMPTSSVSCLIIGCGIAGISAARYLLGAGFSDVKILEASDRIGGRIKSVDIGE